MQSLLACKSTASDVVYRFNYHENVQVGQEFGNKPENEKAQVMLTFHINVETLLTRLFGRKRQKDSLLRNLTDIIF